MRSGPNLFFYTGTSWSKKNVLKCVELEIGMMSSPHDPIQPDDLPKEMKVAYDNGAFRVFRDKVIFGEDLFYSKLEQIERHIDFVCIPDIVCGGKDSYEFSKKHIGRTTHPEYFVVQDGMTIELIDSITHKVDGIFIGGSLISSVKCTGWKWDTAPYWINYAHEIGLPCHIGRIGTLKGYDKAQHLGADSIDGSTLVRHNKLNEITRFREHVKEQKRICEF